MVKINFQMSITRNFGVEQVTIGMSAELEVHSPEDKLKMTNKLYTGIDDMFAHYAASHLPNVNHKNQVAGGGGSAAAAGGGAGGGTHYTEFIPCVRLTMEVKDGKRFFKIKGGEFQKHGVRVWDEMLKTVDIIAADVPLEGLDLAGYIMKVKMDGNKPVRVVTLKRAEG